MNLKSLLMQQLRHIKHIGDSFLLSLNRLNNSQRLDSLETGRYYGYVGSLDPVDQLGNPNPALVEGYYGQINDPAAAARFGTNDLAEYSHWAWRSCGVANIATILKTHGLFNGSLYDLVREIRDKDGYLQTDRWGNSDIGWKHIALAEALSRRGIATRLATRLSIEGLLAEVVDNKFVVASVKSRLAENGSHMVIVLGVEWDGTSSILKLFDPYTLDGEGGLKDMTLTEFIKAYLNKGIVVSWKS